MLNNSQKNFYYNYIYLVLPKIFLSLFFITFFLQAIFWLKTERIKPDYQIIPQVPNSNLLRALSFGDEQFLFRVLSFRIQNSGDVFAGFVALKNYDYFLLQKWFFTLDNLDSRSNLIPALAAYYFSQTQNKKDVIYIVQYLDQHASRNLEHKWWWLFQAINIAEADLQNQDLALELSQKLSSNNIKNLPIWMKGISATIYEKKKNDCMVFFVIKKLIDANANNTREISVDEMNFMRYFIKARLEKLKQRQFNPSKCKI